MHPGIVQVAEAMRHGCVVVVSPIAAEGMNLIHEGNSLIAETSIEFVTGIFEILQNADYADNLANKAFETVTMHFSIHKAQQTLADTLLMTRSDLHVSSSENRPTHNKSTSAEEYDKRGMCRSLSRPRCDW